MWIIAPHPYPHSLPTPMPHTKSLNIAALLLKWTTPWVSSPVNRQTKCIKDLYPCNKNILIILSELCALGTLSILPCKSDNAGELIPLSDTRSFSCCFYSAQSDKACPVNRDILNPGPAEPGYVLPLQTM